MEFDDEPSEKSMEANCRSQKILGDCEFQVKFWSLGCGFLDDFALQCIEIYVADFSSS